MSRAISHKIYGSHAYEFGNISFGGVLLRTFQFQMLFNSSDLCYSLLTKCIIVHVFVIYNLTWKKSAVELFIFRYSNQNDTHFIPTAFFFNDIPMEISDNYTKQDFHILICIYVQT